MTDEDSNTSAHCTDGNVLSRVGCILSYSGSTVDMSINYTLLVINLVWCIVALSLHTKDIGRSTALRTFALSALAFGTYPRGATPRRTALDCTRPLSSSICDTFRPYAHTLCSLSRSLQTYSSFPISDTPLPRGPLRRYFHFVVRHGWVDHFRTQTIEGYSRCRIISMARNILSHGTGGRRIGCCVYYLLCR